MFEKRDEGQNIKEEKSAETIVGTSVRLKGNLRSDGDITVDGHVSGDIKTKASVFVGPNATIVANIKAKNIEISGIVQGNIEAEESLELMETGRVYGDMNTGSLAISPGAVFVGKSTMQEPKEETEFEPVMEEELSEEENPEKEEKEKKKKK